MTFPTALASLIADWSPRTAPAVMSDALHSAARDVETSVDWTSRDAGPMDFGRGPKRGDLLVAAGPGGIKWTHFDEDDGA